MVSAGSRKLLVRKICVFRLKWATDSAGKWATDFGEQWATNSASQWATDSGGMWVHFSALSGTLDSVTGMVASLVSGMKE